MAKNNLIKRIEKLEEKKKLSPYIGIIYGNTKEEEEKSQQEWIKHRGAPQPNQDQIWINTGIKPRF